jgi:hypothetical protein
MKDPVPVIASPAQDSPTASNSGRPMSRHPEATLATDSPREVRLSTGWTVAPLRQPREYCPPRIADTAPECGPLYEYKLGDRRLAFLGAPSLYSSDPDAHLLRTLRDQARRDATISIQEIQLDFIHRVETGIFRNGTKYQLSMMLAPRRCMVVTRGWQRTVSTQTPAEPTPPRDVVILHANGLDESMSDSEAEVPNMDTSPHPSQSVGTAADTRVVTLVNPDSIAKAIIADSADASPDAILADSADAPPDAILTDSADAPSSVIIADSADAPSSANVMDKAEETDNAIEGQGEEMDVLEGDLECSGSTIHSPRSQGPIRVATSTTETEIQTEDLDLVDNSAQTTVTVTLDTESQTTTTRQVSGTSQTPAEWWTGGPL